MVNFLLIASLIIIFGGIVLSRSRFKDRPLGRLALPVQAVGAIHLGVGNWCRIRLTSSSSVLRSS